MVANIPALEKVYQSKFSFRQKCNRELFIKRKNKSIVIVSHNDKLIQQYCDKAMVFHNQQIFDFNNTKEAIKFYHNSIKS